MDAIDTRQHATRIQEIVHDLLQELIAHDLLQEFVSLLGHGEEYLASISLLSADIVPPQPSSSGHPGLAVAGIPTQGGEASGPGGQEVEEMVAAVDSVLRELGEDPQREVRVLPRHHAQHAVLQTASSTNGTEKLSSPY